MKINDLEFHLVSFSQSDLAEPLRSLLVRITTTSGVEGWGESSLAWRAGELAPRREALLAVLEGRSVYDIAELHTLEALSPPPLRSAVEMAVWDALGRGLRQPLCNLLGGFFRRRIPVSVRLVGHKPPLAASISRELAEQGFHVQTIAASGRIDEDLQVLTAVRQLVGGRIELRLDGMALYDADAARELAAGMEPLGVQFLMDPQNTQDLREIAFLGRQTSVPLAVWRSIRGPADAMQAVRCGAAPFLVIDLEQVGGIVPARACAAVASAAGLTAVLGGKPSVGIAAAAMLHLAASPASLSATNEMASSRLRDAVLADPLELNDGMISVPQGFGLGVLVDRGKIEKHQAA